MMRSSELIVLKISAFLLCENIFFKLIIVLILLIDIVKSEKNGKLKVSLNEVLLGMFLIVLNSIFSIDLSSTNFFVLGLCSSIFSKYKLEKILNLYLLSIVFEGVIFYCLNL